MLKARPWSGTILTSSTVLFSSGVPCYQMDNSNLIAVMLLLQTCTPLLKYPLFISALVYFFIPLVNEHGSMLMATLRNLEPSKANSSVSVISNGTLTAQHFIPWMALHVLCWGVALYDQVNFMSWVLVVKCENISFLDSGCLDLYTRCTNQTLAFKVILIYNLVSTLQIPLKLLSLRS